MNLRPHLGMGRDTATTLSELAERLRVPRRSIEEAVQEARLSGVPICTGSEGAWIAQDASEARSMADRLRSRAIHQMETARALEKWADEQEQQPLTLPWNVDVAA